jgi:hypothetical protein
MLTAEFESAALKYATYDPKKKHLTITFNSGHATTYQDVPEEVFRGLKSAKSAGGYFHKCIRSVFVSL